QGKVDWLPAPDRNDLLVVSRPEPRDPGRQENEAHRANNGEPIGAAPARASTPVRCAAGDPKDRSAAACLPGEGHVFAGRRASLIPYPCPQPRGKGPKGDAVLKTPLPRTG